MPATRGNGWPKGEVDAASVIERLRLGWFQTAREVAELVAFLFGPAAAYMTGGTLLADGGLSVLSPLSR